MTMREKLDLYLNLLMQNKGSDLHLQAGSIPRARIHGDLKKIGEAIFTADEMDAMARKITNVIQYNELKEKKNLDFSYVMEDSSRFRVNIFYQMNGLSAVFRIIPVKIPNLDDLNLPKVVNDFAEMLRGLVLVTGVTGSGKSTTLAAILNKINQTKAKHIITVEDPVKFIHQNNKCLVNQRGIGQDSHSFSDALRGALREDLDIILVGEMRDLETVDIALHAANTGHLVFSILHTLDAKETIDRIVGMFGTEEQNRIRGLLTSVLVGVISQRLVPTIDGGRAATIEILKKTVRIEQLIAENRDYEIPDALAEGKEIYGTQTFDQALLDHLRNGRITEETALEYATNPSDMKLKMQGVGKGSITVEKKELTEGDVFGFKEVEEDDKKKH